MKIIATIAAVAVTLGTSATAFEPATKQNVWYDRGDYLFSFEATGDSVVHYRKSKETGVITSVNIKNASDEPKVVEPAPVELKNGRFVESTKYYRGNKVRIVRDIEVYTDGVLTRDVTKTITKKPNGKRTVVVDNHLRQKAFKIRDNRPNKSIPYKTDRTQRWSTSR